MLKQISERKDFWLYSTWVILTFLLAVSKAIFKINDFIDNPEHFHLEHFDAISKVIQYSGGITLGAYYFFLIVNIFWLYYTLRIGYLWVLKMDIRLERPVLAGAYKWFMWGAIGCNVIENSLYAIFSDQFLSWVTYTKWALLAVCFLLVFIHWIHGFLFQKYRSIARFVTTAGVSLLFIAFVYLLLTLMPQGGTLVVDLLSSFRNVFIFFFLLIFLAIVLAHYPTYTEIWWYGSNEVVRLKMSNKRKDSAEGCDTMLTKGKHILSDLHKDAFAGAERATALKSDDDLRAEESNRWHRAGLGYIYYDPSEALPEKRATYDNEDIKRWRRSLGILLYVAVFNIILRVYAQYFEKQIDVLGLTVMILILSLLIYHFHGERYNVWRESLKRATRQPSKTSIVTEDIEDVIPEIERYVRKFPIFMGICFSFSTATSILAGTVGWSEITLLLTFITLTLHLYLYIYFKICRTYLKYVFFTDKLCRKHKAMFKPTYAYLFSKYRKHPSKNTQFNFLIGRLSNNVFFIQIISASGFLALLGVLLLNLSFDFAASINPINVILSYIILIYATIFIIFKHILYYHRNSDILENYRVKRLIGPVVILVIVGLSIFLSGKDSDLHELRLVPEADTALISKATFLKQLQSEEHRTGNNYFYIGSYGGGLKANLWNNLLLFELDSLSRKRFLHKTVAMSGVSGGAVGIGSYTALRYNYRDDYTKMRKAINDIGESNVLSYELTLWLGLDFFRERIPLNVYEGRDRSYYSMREHARITGMGDKRYNRIAYRDYWQRIYDSEKHSYPVLITNTTSTLGKQGVASSLKLPDSIFSGADNILDFDRSNRGKSLTYFGALSTTNRFPLFSPTAEVPSKGHYLDGGYFDNSGLLSVMELHDHFTYLAQEDPTIREMNPVFINIINSKGYYTARKMKEWGVSRADGDKGVGQLSAIIETVVSIDKLPRYVTAKIKNKNFILEELFMPHKIHYSDVEAQLNGQIADPMLLIEKINAHNDSIDTALRAYSKYKVKKWGTVEPPLARLLSTPAVQYQEAMVKHHPSVSLAIERILEYLEEEKEMNIRDQTRMKSLGRRERPSNKSKNDSLTNQS